MVPCLFCPFIWPSLPLLYVMRCAGIQSVMAPNFQDSTIMHCASLTICFECFIKHQIHWNSTSLIIIILWNYVESTFSCTHTHWETQAEYRLLSFDYIMHSIGFEISLTHTHNRFFIHCSNISNIHIYKRAHLEPHVSKI